MQAVYQNLYQKVTYTVVLHCTRPHKHKLREGEWRRP